jgi:hypothetical protein
MPELSLLPRPSCELVADGLVEVQSARRAARPGQDLDALGLLVVQRAEEAGVAGTARRREDRLGGRTVVLVELALPVILGASGRAVRLRDRIRLFRTAEPRLDLRIARELARPEQARGLLGSHTLRDVEARCAGLALLGRDDDHAVGGARSVDGGGRGRLQHLDVLDIVGVEVRKTVDHLILRRRRAAGRTGDRRQTAGNGRVGHDDAIHHVERITLAEDRRGAADLDLHAAARYAAILEDGRADDLARQVAFDRLGRHGEQFLGRHRCNGRRRIALVNRRRLTGHGHAFELQHIPVERKVRRGRPGSNADTGALEADRTSNECQVAIRRLEAILAPLVRTHAELRTHDTNRGFGNGQTACLRHLACDFARLCRKRR